MTNLVDTVSPGPLRTSYYTGQMSNNPGFSPHPRKHLEQISGRLGGKGVLAAVAVILGLGAGAVRMCPVFSP